MSAKADKASISSVLVVDAANVVGSRPDGWWRDRAGAADRLLGRIEAALGAGLIHGPVTVVLEGRARGAATAGPATGDAAGPTPQLIVERAPGHGDDRIVEVASEAVAAGHPVTVVTADRGLMARVHALGAQIEGPGTFLRRTDGAGPH